jgi:hypothetical protein
MAPVDSGALPYNYKQSFSVICFTVADSDLLFSFVDIRSYGKLRFSKFENMVLTKKSGKFSEHYSRRAIAKQFPPLSYVFSGD